MQLPIRTAKNKDDKTNVQPSKKKQEFGATDSPDFLRECDKKEVFTKLKPLFKNF